MKRRRFCLIVFLLVAFWLKPSVTACAAGWEAQDGGEDYLDELFSSIDFSELDTFMEEGQKETSFSGLVAELMDDGLGEESFADLLEWIKAALVSEVAENRKLLVEVVLIAFCFSILKNFAGAFDSSYVSDMCFVLVYGVLALMLLTSIAVFQEIVSDALQKSVEFMKMLVPTFCMSMVFSTNVSSSLGFYQSAFLVIYLVEWIFLNFLLPMVHIYVLLELFNHFWEEEKFMNLTELFRDLIHWGIKIAAAAVLGLNVVQSLITPAKDRMAQGTIEKAAAVIPGVGGAVSSIGEMLLGGGIVVKNSIGTAGLIVLFGIGIIPLAKALCMAFFYKAAAAVTEPVTDKRIAGALKGMSEGALLYMKLLGYGLVLFFLTVALTVAATSFIY